MSTYVNPYPDFTKLIAEAKTKRQKEYWTNELLKAFSTVLKNQRKRERLAAYQEWLTERPNVKHNETREAAQTQYKAATLREKNTAKRIAEGLTKAMGPRPLYYPLNIPTNPGKCWKAIREQTRYGVTIEKKTHIITTIIYDLVTINDIKNALKNHVKNERNTYRISILFGICFQMDDLQPVKNKQGMVVFGENDLPVMRPVDVYPIWRPQTNKFFGVQAKYIGCKKDFDDFLDGVTADKLKTYAEEHMPASGIRVIGITSMLIKTMRGEGVLRVGAKIEVPQHIMDDKNVISMNDSKNNMCFWDCFAYHRIKNKRCKTLALKLFEGFYNTKPTADYKGFHIDDEIEKFESAFGLGVNTYEKIDGKLVHVRQTELLENPLNLLLIDNHCCYIKNVHMLDKSKYKCDTCGHCFRDLYNLRKHIPTCADYEQKDEFPKTPEIYEPPRNMIQQLNNRFNTNCDYKYDPLIVYDFEALVVPMEAKIGDKITITNRQQVVSVSLCSNIDGYRDPYCIVSESPQKLISLMFTRLDEMCEKVGITQKIRYHELFQKIDAIKDPIRQKKELRSFLRYVNQVPILGFNSGKYDINLDIDCFMKELFSRDENVSSIKNGNAYKSLQINKMVFLDICQYLPPNYNLDQYIKAFNKDGLRKSVFPYEFLDSYEKLDFDIKLLERKHFHSKLKNGGITDAEWTEFTVNRDNLGWKTIRDLLVYYNNLDVQPFVQAIVNHKKFFYDEVSIDMFKDGMSLPALAEKIMFKFCLKDFEDNFIHQKDVPFTPLYYAFENIVDDKLWDYRDQDVKADRYNHSQFISKAETISIIHKHKNRCHYCHDPCHEKWTLDRIDNDIGHNQGNCLLACLSCNTSRSNTPYKVFYRKKALLRYDKIHPLIHLIDEANKEVFYLLKKNITGGASIVFHRYHEAGITRIKRPVYKNGEWAEGKEGKMVEQIVGFDANALYLWSIGQDMLCGKLEHKKYEGDGNIHELMKGFHGMVEVDIETPEHLKNFTGEFPLVFKNAEYDSNDVMGDCIKEIYAKEGKADKPNVSRKLISSFQGKKVLIKSDRLRFMLDKGLVVTKIYGYIRARRGKIFTRFVQKVSDERRKGDQDPNHAIIAEMWKLVGNSAFGRTGMNKSKFCNVNYGDEKKYIKMLGSPCFKDANQYGDMFEISSQKRVIKQNIPIQVACSIYDDSKLRMCQFYYDFVDKYLSRDDFQYIEMDTDSAYMALTGDFESLVIPEIRASYEAERHKWFLRNDTLEKTAYDKRVPGLFKPEFIGKGIVALASKTYFVKGFGEKDKFSCKGIQHKHNTDEISFEKYKSVLFDNTTSLVTNKGMRILNDKQVNNTKTDANQNRRIYGYSIQKIGLSGKYDKRVVLDDKVSTVPLNL